MRIFINMKKIVFTEEEVQQIIEMYSEGYMGSHAICKIFNVSSPIIIRVLKENNVRVGVPGRKWKGGVKESSKRYHSKPVVKDRKKENYYRWLEKNKEHRKKYMSEYREKNADKIRERKRIYEKNRKDTDPHYKLACYTRTAVYTCLKENNVSKYKSTFDLLPFTLEELITHLGSQFNDGMCWDNYGEWHVDHIIPMNSFDFDEPNSFNVCWSLGNLQPLWGSENLSKGSKVL